MELAWPEWAAGLCFRSEGREFTSHRCLIPADGFYEFTAPLEPGQKRKTKWLFTMKDHPWFCIAGIWRSHPEIGEAFTMLTMEPGEDVAPYHSRQIIPLPRDRWADWLDPSVPAEEVRPPAEGQPAAAGSIHRPRRKRRCFEVSGRRELDIRRVHIDLNPARSSSLGFSISGI
jgi:putative SOS response-associated peptidase YedK